MFTKKYFLVFCLMSAVKLSAQSYKIIDVKKYFADNADRLDPVEGIWRRNTSFQNKEDSIEIDTMHFQSQCIYMIVFKKNTCYVAADFNKENEVIRQNCSLIETKYQNQYVRTTSYYNNPNVQLFVAKDEITSDFYFNQSVGTNNLKNDSNILIHCVERYKRLYPTEKEIQAAQLNNPEFLLNEGIKSFRKKEYANAISLLSDAIRLNPNLSNAYYFRSSSYYAKKDFSHALADINTAIKQKNNSADFYSLRGSIHIDLKNFKEAILDFSKSIESKPSALGYYNRSIAKYSIADLRGAINDCSKAIELSPTAAMYNQRAWYLFKTGDLKNALTDASSAIKLNAKDANSFDTRGCIYFENNQYLEALHDFNQAIKLNPSLGNSYLYRGRIKFSSGQKTEACKDWNIATTLGENEANELIKRNCK